MGNIEKTQVDLAVMPFPDSLRRLAYRSVGWVTGSRQYGLEIEGSDTDYTFVYLYFRKFAAIQRYTPEFPEHVSWKTIVDEATGEVSFDHKGEDQKVYSFRRFCELLMKGNPNLVELTVYPTLPTVIHRLGQPEQVSTIHKFLIEVAPYIVTPKAAKQYYGHMTAVKIELDKSKRGAEFPTRKRIAHAMRLAYTLEHILEFGEIPRWKRDDEKIGILRDYRAGENYIKECDVLGTFNDMYVSLGASVDDYVKYDNGKSEEVLNEVIEALVHTATAKNYD